MPEVNRNPLDIGYIVYKVGSSEAYAKARTENESLDMSDQDRFRTSIRMAATALRGEQASGYLTPEGHALNLTAQLTTYGKDFRELQRLKDEGANHKDRLPLLQKMSEFNHALKDMLDSNPSLVFNDVVSFLRNMDQKINGSEGALDFEREIKATLNGMRHEIAVEQILGYMSDVEYQEASVEDDLKGIDLFISINDSPMTPIDIKASEATALIKKRKAYSAGHDMSRIIWSQVSESDFNGGFRISNEKAQEKAPILRKKLQSVVDAAHSRNTATG